MLTKRAIRFTLRSCGLAWCLLLSFVCLSPAYGQALTGQLVEQITQKPLGFVSVGVLGHPYGTVADAQGRFSLNLPASFDADSIRFSLIGYASRSWQVGQLRQLTRTGPLLLRAQPVSLPEARVSSVGMKRRVLGNPIARNATYVQYFAANMAGNQVGQRIAIKQPAFLEEVSFVITRNSYDSIRFRLNIYKVRRDYPGDNLLSAPIYFSVSKQQAANRIHLNLRRYHLYLTEDIVVAVELVRSLGKGTLMFGCPLRRGGPHYILDQTPGPDIALNVLPIDAIETIDLKRKQPDGPWAKYPNIGMGIDATVLQLPN